MANIRHSCEGARSARFICWIPAFAGMAGLGLFAGYPQGFRTDCCAGMADGGRWSSRHERRGAGATDM